MKDPRDLVADFVRESAPEQFCAACLAFHAEVSLEESRRIVDELARDASFAVAVGECDACTRKVPVLAFRGSTPR